MAKARDILRDMLGDGGTSETSQVRLSGPVVEMHGEKAQTFVVVHGDLHLHMGPDSSVRTPVPATATDGQP